MNFIKLIQTKIFIHRAKKYFGPDKDFSKKAKLLFILAAKSTKQTCFIQQTSARNNQLAKSHISFFPIFSTWKTPALALASFALLLMMSAGTVAFAEKQNIDPENPLYALKRMGERMQIQLASNSQKIELREKFASRRLEEIQQVTIIHPKPPEKQRKILKELDENFQENVTAVINDAVAVTETIKMQERMQDKKPSQSARPEVLYEKKKGAENLCYKMVKIIEKREEINDSESNWRPIKERCNPILEKEEILKNNDNDSNEIKGRPNIEIRNQDKNLPRLKIQK